MLSRPAAVEGHSTITRRDEYQISSNYIRELVSAQNVGESQAEVQEYADSASYFERWLFHWIPGEMKYADAIRDTQSISMEQKFELDPSGEATLTVTAKITPRR